MAPKNVTTPEIVSQQKSAIRFPEPPRKLRIALYSHDTMGIGHMRRNALIAQKIADRRPENALMMIAGAREANAFEYPEGIDCVTLPAVYKEKNGTYRTRHLRMTLKETVEIRAQCIRASIDAFRPDLFIVDKVPLGAFGELTSTLQMLRCRHQTRIVLGWREILDDPETTRRDWKSSHAFESMRAFFDEIWVYGDRRVFNPIVEYQIPADLAAKVRFMGYLDPLDRNLLPDSPCPGEVRPFALCLVGGGQDGAPLAHAFVDAMAAMRSPALLVTGPCMPWEERRELQRRCQMLDHLSLIEFVPEVESLIGRAERVVAMGGYNTICSILSHRKRALIVPRIQPRREQWVRAVRLHNLGLVDVLDPDLLSGSAIQQWLAQHRGDGDDTGTAVDLRGLDAIEQRVSEIFDRKRPSPLRSTPS